MTSFIYDILYGNHNKNINVTQLLLESTINNIIYIPLGDHNRSFLFMNDPIAGVVKSVLIKNKQTNKIIEFDASKDIYIDVSNNLIYVDNPPEYISEMMMNYYKSIIIENVEKKTEFLHPISFSIPEEKIVNDIPKKTKVISSIIPGCLYSFNTEEAYYNEYKSSMFGTTFKKGGWDCLRHYEILANGCIPYFVNIDHCPENTLHSYPKKLTIEGNNLYYKLHNKNINEISNEDMKEYNTLLNKFLLYTKENLTTVKIAKYILDKSNNANSSKILYLSGHTDPDYLRCLTLHGFKSIFGKNCHDYPKISHLYKCNNTEYSNLYGRGITYSNLLSSEFREDSLDDSIIEDIKNNVYDIIIYGNYHRGTPLFDLIKEHYSQNKIILLCGEDDHICNNMKYVSEKYNVFVRELKNDYGLGCIPSCLKL